MDRPIVYNGSVIRDADALEAAKASMVGLGWLVNAMLAVIPAVDGLACTPGSGLTVAVAPGAVYASEQTDATAYGSLGTDSKTLIKQGLVLTTSALSVPAPVTAGQSINYLIEAQYQDVDGGSTLLPYYNSANPSSPLSGPGNSGLSQNTLRQGVCALQVKAGTAATTGTQTTPTADSGWIGLWVVTVDHGETSLVTGDIVEASGAPFITGKIGAAPTTGVFWAQNTGTSETIALTTWTQRALDAAQANTISGASLTSNQVTLPAGTYKVSAQAGALCSANLSGLAHQLRIRDITAGATLVTGIQNAVLNDPNASSPYQQRLVGVLQGVFTLAATHVIELDSFTDANCTGGGTISVDLLITKIA